MENLDLSNNKNVSLSLIAEYGSDSDSESTKNDTEDEDAPGFSEMVIKNNIINACAHGPLSGSRVDEEISRHMIIDGSDSGVVEYEVTEYRDADSDSESSSSDSSSDVDSVKDVEDLSSGDEIEGSKNAKPEPPKVHGELGLDDLPPIEDLAISLPAQEMVKIGVIASVVDRLVIVIAFPNTPAIDLDSVLFLDNGAKTLGKVFDVFGPVTEPHYCVRFNSQDHVKERGVTPGQEVFIAPQSQHTSYVFLSELMKLKGSDASWLNDIEPPPQHIDYSDDEEERRANKQRKEAHNQKNVEGTDNGETSKEQGRKDTRKNQRPSEFNSRFGTGNKNASGKNPFNTMYKRQPQNTPRAMGYRRHPEPIVPIPIMAPPNFPPFNLNNPTPFMGNPGFQFGGRPRMYPPRGLPPMFRHSMPMFSSNYCNMGGPNPHWVNNGPPPPPGT